MGDEQLGGRDGRVPLPAPADDQRPALPCHVCPFRPTVRTVSRRPSAVAGGVEATWHPDDRTHRSAGGRPRDAWSTARYGVGRDPARRCTPVLDTHLVRNFLTPA